MNDKAMYDDMPGDQVAGDGKVIDHREEAIEVMAEGKYTRYDDVGKEDWEEAKKRCPEPLKIFYKDAEAALDALIQYLADNGIKMVYEDPTEKAIDQQLLDNPVWYAPGSLGDKFSRDTAVKAYKAAIQAGAIELGE